MPRNRLRDVAVTSYDDAARYLETHGRDDATTVAHNTSMHRSAHDEIAVVLHRTAVVTYCRNGDIILDAGGWLTRTTVDRLHRFTPPTIRVNLRTVAGEPYLLVAVRNCAHRWDGQTPYVIAAKDTGTLMACRYH